VAQAIARAVRHSSGGLRYVKALGFEIRERNQVQVSMNLTNYEATPVCRVFEMVLREAERHGVTVGSSEIVGLVPQKALNACAEYYLRVEKFSPDLILENRLAAALERPDDTSSDFVARVASPGPVPGGGSVAAHAGALAAALGEMVAGLTEGRKNYEAVEERVRNIHRELSAARNELLQLVREDAEAYRKVVEALRLPKDSDQEKRARAAAIEQATRLATETPLRTARQAAAALAQLEALVEIGNPNARSDAAAGAQLAFSALKAAQYNVLTNLPGLSDDGFSRRCRDEAGELARRGVDLLARIDARMTS
jgi:glutamate formiminotransferase/formiminotetrahydrofolate cyclodeaminase